MKINLLTLCIFCVFTVIVWFVDTELTCQFYISVYICTHYVYNYAYILECEVNQKYIRMNRMYRLLCRLWWICVYDSKGFSSSFTQIHIIPQTSESITADEIIISDQSIHLRLNCCKNYEEELYFDMHTKNIYSPLI